jgi:hypothetical protein
LVVSKQIDFYSPKKDTRLPAMVAVFFCLIPFPAASLIFPHFLCCFLAILLNTY